jgi:HK97 family phage portal protein
MNLKDRFSTAMSVLTGKAIPRGEGTWTIISGGSSLTGHTKQELLAQYTSWVYACVNIRAKAVSAARFRLYKKVGVDEFLEVEDHPLYQILGRPNPWNTKSEFLYQSVTHLDLTGDVFWYVARNGLKVPAEMWVLPVENVKIIPSESDFISRYEMKRGNKTIPFSTEEIVHVKYPAPNDPYYGLGPLSAAQYASSIDNYQNRFQNGFYRNSAIPALSLQTDKTLTPASMAALREQWHSQYGGDNQGKTAVLDNGLKAVPIGVSPKDLDWLSTNRATRDQILGIFGVPATMLGLTEDSNRASALVTTGSFAINVVEPILKLMDEKLTIDLAQKFDPNLIVKHDSTVPKDEEIQASTMEKRLNVGLTTRNEERKLLGYKPIEGGDTLLVPMNYQDILQPEIAPEEELNEGDGQ